MRGHGDIRGWRSRLEAVIELSGIPIFKSDRSDMACGTVDEVLQLFFSFRSSLAGPNFGYWPRNLAFFLMVVCI